MEMNRYYQEQLQEEMQCAVHPSGLRVYVFPKKGFQKYYAIYGTEYGSIDSVFQVPGEDAMIKVPDGIAHYLEHKMFEEEDGGDAFQRFALTGANSNAFTSFDMTAYLFSCTDRFYENLDILLDFVNCPCFTEENVAKEQGIIGQEIKMYEDDPEWRVFFNTLTALFHNNPVKIDIAGTVESIAQITPELLYRCYHTFYNPANMVLVLVGDVDMETAMSYVDKHVDASRNLGQIPREEVVEPRERVQERISQKLVVSQPLFRIGFKDCNMDLDAEAMMKKELATEVILDAVFGRCSDLYHQLYESGFIDSTFDAEADLSKRYGFSLLGGESKDPEAVYAKIKERLAELMETGIPAEDIARSKKKLKSSHIRIFNSVERMGNTFIRQIFSGYNPLSAGDALNALTEQEINDRLREHFAVDNCVLSVVYPMDEE
ncbi:MAG: insulinase family protein [Clostridia bacterium]|nr:insulinase family protein [Clostridia bacterium]